MGERVGNSFRVQVLAGILVTVLAVFAAFWMLARGSVLDGIIVATVTFFAFKWFWRATLRRRELLRLQYYVGRRVGTHWVYDAVNTTSTFRAKATGKRPCPSGQETAARKSSNGF
jgi:hypothetical protein